jgi:hypothetical protein
MARAVTGSRAALVIAPPSASGVPAACEAVSVRSAEIPITRAGSGAGVSGATGAASMNGRGSSSLCRLEDAGGTRPVAPVPRAGAPPPPETVSQTSIGGNGASGTAVERPMASHHRRRAWIRATRSQIVAFRT